MNTIAIFTHNNAFDTILLPNGKLVDMYSELFDALIRTDINRLTSHQNGDDWTQHGKDITTAAQAYGDIIATIESDGTNHTLRIINGKEFEWRQDFYKVWID